MNGRGIGVHCAYRVTIDPLIGASSGKETCPKYAHPKGVPRWSGVFLAASTKVVEAGRIERKYSSMPISTSVELWKCAHMKWSE